MKGAPLEDWISVAMFDVNAATRVFGYDVESMSLRPYPIDVPWPVVWLLCSFSRKHAFVSDSRPDIPGLASEVNEFINKIKWTFKLSGGGVPTGIR